MYENVILTGGNTMIEGFVERFEAELKSIEQGYYIKTLAP